MALQAIHEPYQQVGYEVETLFVNGVDLGIGMIQADPANFTSREALFLHSNIVKWSMRDFLCVGCPAVDYDIAQVSYLEDRDHPINKHLREGRRIFDMTRLKAMNIDPEPMMWKCIEHTACRSSVWGNKQVCRQAQDHMTRVFGFEFRSNSIASAVGYGDDVCVIDPPPVWR